MYLSSEASIDCLVYTYTCALGSTVRKQSSDELIRMNMPERMSRTEIATGVYKYGIFRE